jgi:hypothetical protein
LVDVGLGLKRGGFEPIFTKTPQNEGFLQFFSVFFKKDGVLTFFVPYNRCFQPFHARAFFLLFYATVIIVIIVQCALYDTAAIFYLFSIFLLFLF